MEQEWNADVMGCNAQLNFFGKVVRCPIEEQCMGRVVVVSGCEKREGRLGFTMRGSLCMRCTLEAA